MTHPFDAGAEQAVRACADRWRGWPRRNLVRAGEVARWLTQVADSIATQPVRTPAVVVVDVDDLGSLLRHARFPGWPTEEDHAAANRVFDAYEEACR